MENNKNFVLAIALSVAVLFAWEYFYVKPMSERAQRQQAVEAAQKAQNTPKPEAGAPAGPAGQAQTPQSVPAPAPTPAAFATREEAIKSSPRIQIDSPALLGSINLKGGRIDDVILRNYNETVSPHSPKTVLLSPSGSPHPYFAVTGWLDQAGHQVPDQNALWEQEGTGSLTVGHSVTLRYDNGQGLVFRRTISIDDRYMFTVSDEVENKSGQAVTLRPWGQVARLTEPKTSGYTVLHEGLIASLGNEGIKDYTYSAAQKNFENNVLKDTYSATGGWAGFTDQYWATVLIPNSKTPYTDSDVWQSGQAVLCKRPRNAGAYRTAGHKNPG